MVITIALGVFIGNVVTAFFMAALKVWHEKLVEHFQKKYPEYKRDNDKKIIKPKEPIGFKQSTIKA